LNWRWILAAMGIALAVAMAFSNVVRWIVILPIVMALPLAVVAGFGYCIYRGFRPKKGKRQNEGDEVARNGEGEGRK
jgi:hypothetical protein